MRSITELYFVTGNPVKFQEVSTFFAKYAPQISVKQFDVDLPEIQTLDQTAIAVDKARQAWNLLKTDDRMYIRIVLAFMYGDNECSVFESTTHGIFDKTHRLDLHKTEAPFDTVFIPDGAGETVDILRLKGEAEPYQYRMRALHKFIGTN